MAPKRPTRKARRSRKQKNMFHFVLIALIGASLFVEGAGHADWLFLALAGVVEFG